MNIDHIESFLYIVEHKSVRKAAHLLFLSQPTVSSRLKALENSLGAPLFIRKGRSLLLTEEGKLFISYAEQIVAIYRESQQKIQNF